ncbi:sigma 54-interacting transcriptional regulator [Pseudodesulfovibrio sp.]|uniref:sigma-54 interaction domain-containing protein n=1 Tax=Pseudodesulfovibrio sp. TaxID=2035812 RepID=UPI0026163527|nr:sigma 54-interacting transcriptional regulator [Pseudodesulfovibrio sp.]MDD3312213.1 sigma 54-interacting transcriptional regulator [Pseudodesulfovibrio sp.]
MPTLDPAILKWLLPDTDSLTDLLDELPLGVAVMGWDGTLLAVNKTYETLTGADRQSLVGLKCLHGLRCDYCFKGCPVLAGWKKVDARSAEANIISRNRNKVYVRLTISPILGDKGEVRGAVETVSTRATHTLEEGTAGLTGLGNLVGNSPEIQRIFTMVPAIAQTDSSVLITGETGTGKDMLAEEIHNASDRNDGPFIKVNCGALPDTLLESELFGHAKGAFTGADRAKPGRFRMAHGGTLFLTEIGDLPLALQVKLLSFLDDKVIYPLGSTKGFHADVRVIVATHRDLEEMVRQRRFRQDLLYRLNVIRLHLPPLRNRGDDIHLLQDHFLKMFQARFGKKVEGFSANAQALLEGYPYPGNVRELRNLIEYAVNFCDGKQIHTHHLPGYLLRAPAAPSPEPEPEPAGPSAAQPDVRPARTESWEEVQRRMVLDALVKTGGRKRQAAELLGWGRSTLWRKMKHYGID